MPSTTEDKYAATAWGNTGEDLTCPSGQVCLVRKVDMVDLLAEGILNKVDFLTSIVSEELVPNAGPTPKIADAVDAKAMRTLLDKPEQMKEFGQVVETVVAYTVVKPALSVPPRDANGKIDEARKVDGLVYTDSINFTDKMFIFNYALGNSGDLEKFREDADEPVGDVESSEGVSEPPL